jgi:hypothetical protein
MALIALLIGIFMIIGLRRPAADESPWPELNTRTVSAALIPIVLATSYLLFSWAVKTG